MALSRVLEKVGDMHAFGSIAVVYERLLLNSHDGSRTYKRRKKGEGVCELRGSVASSGHKRRLSWSDKDVKYVASMSSSVRLKRSDKQLASG